MSLLSEHHEHDNCDHQEIQVDAGIIPQVQANKWTCVMVMAVAVAAVFIWAPAENLGWFVQALREAIVEIKSMWSAHPPATG